MKGVEPEIGPVVQRYERPPRTDRNAGADWAGYKRWLDEQFSHCHAVALYNLAIRHEEMLLEPSKLLTLPANRRPYVRPLLGR